MDKNKSARLLAAFLIVLAGLASVIVYAAYSQYKMITESPMKAFITGQQQTEAAAGVAADRQSVQAGSAPQDTGETQAAIAYGGRQYAKNTNVINILLLGIDWDATRQDMGWRSDMNMLCSVDFAAGKISLTAIPRDTRAKVYYLNMKNGAPKSSDMDKINAAYSYGGGPDKWGADNAMRCIGEFLSLKGKYSVPVDYYISIDLQGIPEFARALGGVNVTLDVNFPGLGKKGDTVLLNEQNARAYLENRKEVGGELVRIAHEQQYLMAVAQKIKEKGAVSSAPSLYASLLKFMRTNLTLEQIIALAKVLDNGSADDISLQIIKGDFDEIDDISYYIADTKDVEKKVVSLMYTPLAGNEEAQFNQSEANP